MALPRLTVLWIGIRPKTLSMSVMPVAVALALSIHNNHNPNWIVLSAILLAAISIQIATNLFNDAQDYLNGTDTGMRIGPKRITQSGLASPNETKAAAFLFILIASICGAYLIWIGGLQIGLIGIASLLCAYAYSNGPLPIARSPLGELFVLLFFGIIALNASYYLLVGTWPENGFLYGIALGCPAAAILLLNNYRDLENDRLAGRKTLAILLGNNGSKTGFAVLHLIPYLLLYIYTDQIWFLLGLPLALLAIFKVYNAQEKMQLNPCLGISAGSQILLSLGLISSFL